MTYAMYEVFVQFLKLIYAVIITLAMLSLMYSSASASRFGQTILQFEEPKSYRYAYDPSDRSLVIDFKGVAAADLSSAYVYDETVVRRVIIKEQAPHGCELRFVLRDPKVRVSVTEFKQPFRVVVDFFDEFYSEQIDPKTGFPFIASSGDQNSLNPFVEFKGQPSIASEHSTPKVRQKSPQRLQLLKPDIKSTDNSDDIIQAASEVGAGLGASWKTFPAYVYRVELYPYLDSAKHVPLAKSKELVPLTDIQAAADYASKQFDLGHEARALLAYQTVLQRSPLLFDREVMHLWRLSEIYLGQGNLTLAQGYYQAIIDKHPGSPMIGFAKMRLLDLQAIRLSRLGRWEQIGALSKKAADLASAEDGELETQLLIRKSFWNGDEKTIRDFHQKNKIPSIMEQDYQKLRSGIAQNFANRTEFLSQTLILNHMTGKQVDWNPVQGKFIADYFRRFSGKAAEPYRSNLKDRLKNHLVAHIDDQAREGQFLKNTQDFERLPESLKSVVKDPDAASVLARSYQAIGQDRQASKLFKKGMKAQNPLAKLTATFNYATTMGALAYTGQGKVRNVSDETSMKQADQTMLRQWRGLSDSDKQEFLKVQRKNLEASLAQEAPLRGPAVILLQHYQGKTEKTGDKKILSTFSGETPKQVMGKVKVLAARFRKVGLQNKWRESLKLIAQINPEGLQSDELARREWSQLLLTLADDYRVANNYLEAGRIYASAGAKNPSWEGSAESLFKGGLLLYRAGRRDEAIQAFKTASQDSTNRYYAELAKERLEKLTE
jgi:tetratricopeptide (TPR) repeat protein